MHKKLIYLFVSSLLISCSLKSEQLIHEQHLAIVAPVVTIEQKVDRVTGSNYFAYCSDGDCPEHTKKVVVADNATIGRMTYETELPAVRKNVEILTTKTTQAEPLKLRLDTEFKSIKETIPFAADSERLGIKGNAAVTALLGDAMKADKIYVRGRTDASGSQSQNIMLAKKRAAEVSQAMINAGVSKSKITQSYCTECFIADNDNVQNRVINRRVDVEMLIKK